MAKGAKLQFNGLRLGKFQPLEYTEFAVKFPAGEFSHESGSVPDS